MLPTDITGACVLWLKADSFTGYTHLEGITGNWTDSSPSSATVTRTGNPKYVVDATPLGTDAVRFGSSEYFSITGGLLAGSTTAEVFLVCKSPGASLSPSGWRIGGNAPSVYPNTSGRIEDGTFTGSWYYVDPLVGVVLTNYNIYSLRHNGTVRTASIGGVDQDTETVAYTIPSSTWRIGWGGHTSLYFDDGEIAEVVVFNRILDSTERAGIVAYLTERHIEGPPPVTVVVPSANATATAPVPAVIFPITITVPPADATASAPAPAITIGVPITVTVPPAHATAYAPAPTVVILGPANDHFADALVLDPDGGSDTQDMTGVTTETGEPDTGANGTAWLVITPGVTDVTFTCDPLVATFQVWQGTAVDDLTEVVIADVDGEAVWASATGDVFHIQLVDYSGGTQIASPYSWTVTARVVPLSVTIRAPDVEQTPSSVIASVTGGTADATVTFAVDGTDVVIDTDPLTYAGTWAAVWVDVLDDSGVLTDAAIPLPELLAGTSNTPGQEYQLTVVETGTGRTGAAVFSVLTDPLGGPDDYAEDVPPEAVLPAVVQRWVIEDVTPGDTSSYTFPYNPAAMTSPHVPREITVEVTTAVDGQALSYEGARRPHPWQFSGWLLDQDHHDALAAYVASNRRYYLTDHHNRTWKVIFDAFEAQPQITASEPWAHKYTVRAYILSGPWVGPVVLP